MARDCSGYSGDDVVKYGTNGLFPQVLQYLNGKFTPSTLAATKSTWDTYIANLGGNPNSHAFGKFAAVLMEPLFSQGSSQGQNFPTKAEWIRDSSIYNGQPIDSTALAAMGAALRDNLQAANPVPMSFHVGASTIGKHYVESASTTIGGVTGIAVTLYCPADQG
jgi:hypothetical protein